ncbi:MAG: hypothetical protein ACXWKC_15635 [Xanthobacteraceae bacterium]
MRYLETILILGGAVLVLAVIWWQTKSRGRFGLGMIGGAACPRCGTAQSALRKPRSVNEMLWGGWTCPGCGCSIDKYGRERTAG